MRSKQSVLAILLLVGAAQSFVSRTPWAGSPLLTNGGVKFTSLGSERSVATSSATGGERSDRGGPRNDNARGDNPRGRPGPRRNFNNDRGGPRNNNNFRGGPGNRRGPPGQQQRGPPGPALKLENPMKVQRIPYVPPPRQPRQERSQGGGGGPPRRQSPAGAAANRPSGPVASVGEGAGGESDGGSSRRSTAWAKNDGDGPPAEGGGRARRQPQKKARPAGAADNRGPRRPSLRIGTGKRGRGAQVSMRRGSLKKRNRAADKELKAQRAVERNTVSLPDGPLTVSQLAEILDEKPVAVIKFLMTDLGVMAGMTQSLDPATCVSVVEGFGKYVGDDDDEDYDEDDDEDDDEEESALEIGYALDEDDEEDLVARPPVVTIMGHVDHGKTSLLDTLRNTRVTAGEAGGITQHIAAYQLKHRDNKITFIDTPGHAAFTDMRQRGANITDIVILVVAADDGVKEQTADSIICARQAGVPIVVAVNKIDLETADPDRVKSELTKYEVLTEDLGGDVLCTEISAKEGTGLDELLDKVMLQAELENMRANPNRDAQGAIIEARVERGLGTVATTLIQRGTIKVGDIFVAGSTSGRVRALIGPDGKTRLKEAGPSTPVNVVGFEGIPAAGDLLVVADNEQDARELAESRQRILREKESQAYQSGLMGSVTSLFDGSMNKEKREMCVVVKADVQGSAEALTRALSELKLEDDEAIVTVKVLVSDVGEVTKSDIIVASVTPDTTVLAFNVPASFDAMEDARASNIPIEYYNIVYDAIESVESRMQEVLSPTPEGEYVGKAVVQEVFNIGGTGNIAGSRCLDGYLRKGSNVRVMRGDKILTESTVRTLRNFKSEVDMIEEGNECGIGLMDFEDFQPEDIIECYVESKKK